MAGTILLKTGRTRTVECGGTISGYWAGAVGADIAPVDGDPVPCPPEAASGTVFFQPPFAGSVEMRSFINKTLGVWYAGMILTADIIGGATGVPTGTVYALNGFAATVCTGWSLDWSATVVCQALLEEMLSVRYNDPGSDAPHVEYATFFERTKEGGTITCQISSGGVTVNDSLVVGTPVPLATGYVGIAQDPEDLYYDCWHGCRYQVVQTTGHVNFRTHFGATEISAPFSDSFTSGANFGTINLNSGVDSLASGGTSNLVYNALMSPPRKWALEAIARKPSGVYDGTIGLEYIEVSTGSAAYGTAGRHDLNVVNGTATASGTQQHYSVGALVLASNTRPGTAVNQWYPLLTRARAGSAGDGDSYSLLALGEDRRDQRALFRPWPPFDAFSIAQAGTVVVDAGTSLSPSGPSGTPYAGTWIPAGGTVGVENGSIHYVGTVTGSLRRSFGTVFAGSASDGATLDANAPFNAYRYLDVPVRTEGTAKPFTLSVDTVLVAGSVYRYKTWSTDWLGSALVAGTALGTVRIDLCNPGNRSETIDRRDTYLPYEFDVDLSDPAGFPDPFPGTAYGDGPYWGVTLARGLLFNSLGSGSWWLGTIALKRRGTVGSKLDVLPKYVGYPPVYTDWEIAEDRGTAVGIHRFVYHRNHLFGETDGKRSLELFDMSISETGLLTEWDIAEEFAQFGSAYPAGTSDTRLPFWGWSGSLLAGTTVPPDCGTIAPSLYGTIDAGTISDWLNRYRPAAWVRGAGLMRDGTAWTYTDELDASSTVTLKAQMLVDRINWHPDIGNICEQGGTAAYGGSITLHAAYMVRGGISGLTLSSDGTPMASQIVTTYDLTQGEASGSGTSDSYGWYRSTVPFFRGTHVITGACGATSGTVVNKSYNKHRFRVCWKPGAASWIAYDVSPAGRHIRTWLQASRIQVGYASNATPTSWNDRDTGTVGHQPAIRFHEMSHHQRAYLLYGQGTAPAAGATPGTVLLAYTPDEGGSLMGVATIFNSGRWPRIHITRDGRKLCYAWLGSAIIGKILDAQDNVIVPQFTAVAAGVDDDAIDAHEYFAGGGVWKVKLVYRSGGTVIDAISTDGVNFA